MTLGRRLLAMASAVALLVALLLLSSLGVVREPPPKQPTVLENVRLYVPPTPPPGPEPVEPNDRAGSAGTLQVNIPRRDVELGLMKLDTRAAAAVQVPSGYGLGGLLDAGIGRGAGNGAGDFAGGIPAVFAVNQLDAMPMVISAPPVNFLGLDRLRRLNISELRVMFQVLVDEEGHTHPVRIIQSPYPELEGQLMEYAARTVFTPPLHLGRPVKAEYLWPVLFSVAPSPLQ